MASSELSSSEINQGQGEYHDGKNELPDMPVLPSPLSPALIPLDTEENIWKKYSSHYEFPLSLVIALGIHVMAILFVIAFMAVSFYWGAPKPPDTGTVVIIDPRVHQDGNEQQERPGGSNGNEGENAQEPRSITFDPLKLSTPEANTAINLDPTGSPLPAPLPQNLTRQTKRAGAPGKPDGGIGDESGSNIGNTPGSGVPMGRNKRWRIQFSYDEPELLLSQLANLKVTVACRLNNGRFLVFKQLAESVPHAFEEMTTDSFASWVNQARQLWFINNDRITCENFAYAVNLADRPLTLVLVIPHEMEQAILAAELKHHQMTEAQLRARRMTTSFKVVREGENWKVSITKSEVIQQKLQ